MTGTEGDDVVRDAASLMGENEEAIAAAGIQLAGMGGIRQVSMRKLTIRRP